MQRLYVSIFLFLCFSVVGWHGKAQTITLAPLSASAVCAGSAVTIPFSTSGVFLAGNTFTAQLSDASGAFPTSPITLGTLSTVPVAAATLNINGTVASSVGAGTYKIRVISSNPAKSSGNTVTLVVTAIPAAPTVQNLNYCQGVAAPSLSATPQAGGSLNWYAASAGGTASPIPPIPATTAPGSTDYYVSQTLNGCEGPRAKITVTVTAQPSAPLATTALEVCAGQPTAALTATAQTGATLRWYGTQASGGAYTSTPTVPSNTASATYYVSQAIGTCESSRTAIGVTVKPKPSPPAVAAAPSYCPTQPADALVAQPAAGATLRWYGASSTGGTSTTIATVPSTAAAGTTTYYVSQVLNGCESDRAAIAVTVKPTPSAPTVTASIGLCQNVPANPLTATPSANGSLLWYTTPNGGTATAAPTPITSSTATTTYYVSQSVQGCEGPRAAITTTVYPIPPKPAVTPPPSEYCQGSTAPALEGTAATGGTLRWYGTNATGGAYTSAQMPSTSSVGKQSYFVSQVVNGCESERNSVEVSIKTTPAKPTADPLTFCQDYAAPSFNVKAVAGATLNWYGENANGGTASDKPPIIPTNIAKTYTYYVSQTLNGCESGLGDPTGRAAIAVTVKPTPGLPGVSDISYCNNAPTASLQAAGTDIKWYDSNNNPYSGTPTPDSKAVGTQTFFASQTQNGCESTGRAKLTVTIKPLPAAPGVTDLVYCQTQPDQPAQTVGPLTAAGDNLRWYNLDGNAFGGTPTPSIDQPGVSNFQVSQTVNGCEGGKATLRVTVNSTPKPTISSSLITYCINQTAAPLQATAVAGGKLFWVDPYNKVLENAPTPSTLNANVKPGGDEFQVFQQGTNGCYGPRAVIKVIVNVTPTLGLTGPSEINLGLTAPLHLHFEGAGPYSYSITGGYRGVSNAADTTIMVLPRANTVYQVEAVTNACGAGIPGSPATATIAVIVPRITTAALTATTLCAGSVLDIPFSTTGSFTPTSQFWGELVSAADTTRKWTISPNTNNPIVSATIPTTLASGQYFVRVNATNPAIGITGANSPSVLTVYAIPSATLSGTQTIYEGYPTTLTITFTGEAPWNITYADSLQSYSATAATNPYLFEIRPARTTTYRLVSVSNGCGTGALSGTATVSVQKPLGIETALLESSVNVYPIPAQQTLTITIDALLLTDPAILTFTDLSGKTLWQHQTRQTQTDLNVQAHPTGQYLLHIRIGDRTTTRRILKQ